MAHRERSADSSRPRQTGLTRREVLAGTAGAVGAAAVPAAAQQAIETTRRPGPLPSERGERSPFVDPRRDPSSTSSRTPLQDLRGTITPADLHFERHHGGIPTVDPDRYELLVHGLVDRPTIFTLDDLKRFPATSRICFLECSGNLRRGGPETLPQMVCGLTSQTEWTGVLLSTVLREVRRSGRRHVVPRRGAGRGGDDPQRPDGEGVRRRHARLRAERRRPHAGQRLSRAAAPAGLGGQRQREVAATHRARRRSVHDPRGDVRSTPTPSATAAARASSASSWTRAPSSPTPPSPASSSPAGTRSAGSPGAVAAASPGSTSVPTAARRWQ